MTWPEVVPSMAVCPRGPMAHKAQALWEIYTSECCHLETLMLLCRPFLAALRHIQATSGAMQRLLFCCVRVEDAKMFSSFETGHSNAVINLDQSSHHPSYTPAPCAPSLRCIPKASRSCFNRAAGSDVRNSSKSMASVEADKLFPSIEALQRVSADFILELGNLMVPPPESNPTSTQLLQIEPIIGAINRMKDAMLPADMEYSASVSLPLFVRHRPSCDSGIILSRVLIETECRLYYGTTSHFQTLR